MNYSNIYNKLIDSRKYRALNKEPLYEIHHIVPICMGGSNDGSNLVKLTFREHYIVHWLLTKIYPNHVGIQYSFLCMLRDPHGDRRLTSRMIETIKKNFSEFKKWHMKINNPMFKQSAKDKISERMKKNNPNTGGTWNHTSYPVEIIFDDGSIKMYSYMKEAANDLEIPYTSMKLARRKGLVMKKYGIKEIRKYEG